MSKRRPWLMLAYPAILAAFIVGCTLQPAPGRPRAGAATLPVSPRMPPASAAPGPGAENPPVPPVETPPQPALPGPILVVVENHPDARPQSGLDRADVVWEMEVEGGITRFLAVFYRHAAARIGPIRSVRPYMLDLARPYDAPLAHAGGSVAALATLGRDRSFKNMDEIYGAGAYFWRTSDRKMPHNLYSSTERLLAGARAFGYSEGYFPPWPQGQVSGGEPAERVEVRYARYPGYRYEAGWEYDGRLYVRIVNGAPAPMLDGAAVHAGNVIVLAARHRELGDREGHLAIDLTGEGSALFFSRGQVYRGRWQRPSAERPFGFFTDDGQAMRWAPGPVWIEIVREMADVVYGGSNRR